MENNKIGLVIGTYSAVPYIHLHLEARKRLYPHVPMLVHDDFSHNREFLRELCAGYGVEFTTSDKRQKDSLGDVSTFVKGLRWAHEKGLDYLVKFSRRFVPVIDWTPGFNELAKTGHHTFSNITRSYSFGFRTECTGMRMQDWIHPLALGDLENVLLRDQEIFVEGHMHNIARMLNQLNPAAQHWDDVNRRPADMNAYAVWPFMGEDRHTKSPGFYWHNSHSAEEFLQLANSWGLNYTLSDFEDANERSITREAKEKQEEKKPATRRKKVFIDCGVREGEAISAFFGDRNAGGGVYFNCLKERSDAHEFEVTGFESPDYKFMHETKALLADRKVTLHEKLVWTYDGTIAFDSDGQSPDCRIFEVSKSDGRDPWRHPNPDAQLIETPCIDLAGFISSNFTTSDYVIVKMDIEGAEYDILKKMIDTGAIFLLSELYVEYHWWGNAHLRDEIETFIRERTRIHYRNDWP